MAKQVINTGSIANDGTGDPWRTAMTKSNGNFDDLYTLADHPEGFVFQGSTRRFIMRGGNLCIDRTISPTGFPGSEGIDWENVVSY